MDRERLKTLLRRLSRGEIGVEEALEGLRAFPYADLGVACVDHHRSLRRGVSEVIFGQGKTTGDILAIMAQMLEHQENILVTRLSADKARAILEAHPEATYHDRARALTLLRQAVPSSDRPPVLVMCAGTSDIPVAEEAAVTAAFLGNPVERVYDVGVAGLHRLLAHWDKLQQAGVIIVAAGMEGALPSVVGGLVDKPVIAVPTSVGYGASFQGMTALLGMLNSCAAGVTVVNIDNGFGAGYAASLINRVGGEARAGSRAPPAG